MSLTNIYQGLNIKAHCIVLNTGCCVIYDVAFNFLYSFRHNYPVWAGTFVIIIHLMCL